MNRILATRYGACAAELIAEREFGQMVALKNEAITSILLKAAAGMLKLADPGNALIKKPGAWEPALAICDNYRDQHN